jgi:hypothetical protein
METRRRMLTEGVIAGVIGYAAIALFYAALDITTGRPAWATARLLGTGLVDPAVTSGTQLAPVLAFNALHLLVLLVVGTVGSFLLHETQRHPGFWPLTAFIGALGLVLLEAAFVVFTPDSAVRGWSLVAANALAAACMAAFFLTAHRSLLRSTGGRKAAVRK